MNTCKACGSAVTIDRADGEPLCLSGHRGAKTGYRVKRADYGTMDGGVWVKRPLAERNAAEKQRAQEVARRIVDLHKALGGSPNALPVICARLGVSERTVYRALAAVRSGRTA